MPLLLYQCLSRLHHLKHGQITGLTNAWFTCRQVRYRRQLRRSADILGNLPDPDHPAENRDPAEEWQKMEEYEDMYHWFQTQAKDRNLIDTLIRDEEKHKKFVAYKTIQHKFFKPEKEVNLLTWDAQEQIRYLIQEFPEEWTVEKLADSFPISKEGVVKLLKNDQPRTLEEIQRHDERVRKRWLLLKAGGGREGGPIALRYQQLLTEGKLALMANATGIKHLPKPPEQKFLKSPNLSNLKHKPGRFESIVKDYVEKKKLEQQAASSNSQKENEYTNTMNDQEILESIVSQTGDKKMFQGKIMQQDTSNKRISDQDGVRADTEVMISNQDSGKVSYSAFQKKDVEEWDSNHVSDQRMKYIGKNNAKPLTMFDAVKSRSDSDSYLSQSRQELTNRIGESKIYSDVDAIMDSTGQQRLGRRVRRQRGNREFRRSQSADSDKRLCLKLADLESLQMQGTSKIIKSNQQSRQFEDLHDEGFVDKDEEFLQSEYSHVTPETKMHRFADSPNKKILEDVRVDTYKDTDIKEPYLYDDVKGYQNPYGEQDKTKMKVFIPKKKKVPTATLR